MEFNDRLGVHANQRLEHFKHVRVAIQNDVHRARGQLAALIHAQPEEILFTSGATEANNLAILGLADYGKEVRIHGMRVVSGDLVHMDRHGAVTIPEAVAEKIPAACKLLARKEAVILEMARAPGFDIEKLKVALAKQDEIH